MSSPRLEVIRESISICEDIAMFGAGVDGCSKDEAEAAND